MSWSRSVCFSLGRSFFLLPFFVAKKLLENIIPPWGAPTALHSDLRTHFAGQAIQELCGVPSLLHRGCIADTVLRLQD